MTRWQASISRATRSIPSGTTPSRPGSRPEAIIVGLRLTGQHALTSQARAAMFAAHCHRCRDDLRLDRGCELLCLSKTKPEVRQAGLLIAFEACDLHLCRRARLQFCDQLHPPNHFRHQLTLAT